MHLNGTLLTPDPAEMGLGKTVQTISFLSWLKYTVTEKNETLYPHLVIAPASVLANWEREFKKFAPRLNVVKYHGSMAEREQRKTELRPYLPRNGTVKHEKDLDVILAPITYFQKEKSDDGAFLRKFRFEYLVVDEAHVLKNARNCRYKTLDKFTTEHRLLLTGTPVQNTPKELLSLLCFLMPLFSRRGSSFDEANRNDGGESMLQHFVSLEGGSVTNEGAYLKLKQLFAPFVLRRRKQDVLSQVMPPKTQKVEYVELDNVGRTVYDGIIARHVATKGTRKDSGSDHLFTQLRKAAHHPLMLRTRITTNREKDTLSDLFYKYGAFRGDGCTKEKVAEHLEGYSDFELHLTALELINDDEHRRQDLEKYVLSENDLYCSAKFVKLRRILPELISNGHRILLFSVWTTCLDLLSCLLESMGIEHMRMDGSSAVAERQSQIDKFNTTPSIPIFLLSTKACGLGINLTSADTCIFHDVDFNPMNDAQAEDRCHRIGQTKPVTVIRLVAKNTVDSDIYEMQQRKSEMSALIMSTNNEKEWKGTSERSAVLKNALNRFFQSPKGKIDKENTNNFEEDDK